MELVCHVLGVVHHGYDPNCIPTSNSTVLSENTMTIPLGLFEIHTFVLFGCFFLPCASINDMYLSLQEEFFDGDFT